MQQRFAVKKDLTKSAHEHKFLDNKKSYGLQNVLFTKKVTYFKKPIDKLATRRYNLN